jgi:hypothetical protein
LKIRINKILCEKCVFDEKVNPVKLQFKAQLKYDLTETVIDFEISMDDIEFELKDNPLKLNTYRCDNMNIISEDQIVIENLEIIKKDIINYLLNSEINVSWWIFAISHRLAKWKLRLVK